VEGPSLAAEHGTRGPKLLGERAGAFSARYSGLFEFARGNYFFSDQADDGSRVFVNGKTVLDKWGSCCTTWGSSSVPLAGMNTIVAEMKDKTGPSKLRVSWALEPTCAADEWTVQYFADLDLADHKATKCVAVGSAVKALEVDTKVPGLPEKGFGVRAKATVDFQPAGYDFVGEDGGASRLFVDGRKVYGRWLATDGRAWRFGTTRLAGPREITMEVRQIHQSKPIKLAWEASCRAGEWKLEFFTKQDFSDLVATRCHEAGNSWGLQLDYGTASVPGMPGQNGSYSMRATGAFDFDDQPVQLAAASSGGARVTVGETTLINQLSACCTTWYSPFSTLGPGLQTVVAEWAQTEGPARFMVKWDHEVQCAAGSWLVQYFAKPNAQSHMASECRSWSAPWNLAFDFKRGVPALGDKVSGYSVRAVGDFSLGDRPLFVEGNGDARQRVSVNGVVVVDKWKGAKDQWASRLFTPSGVTRVLVEMEPASNPAAMKMRVREEPKCSAGFWTIQYYTDDSLSNHVSTKCLGAGPSARALVMNFGSLGVPDLDGQTSPFSVRATGKFRFPRGQYVMKTGAAGATVKVGGLTVVDAWKDARKGVESQLLAMGGVHEIEVAYKQAGTPAKFQFGWTPVCPVGTWTLSYFSDAGTFTKHRDTRCVHGATGLRWESGVGPAALRFKKGGWAVRAEGQFQFSDGLYQFTAGSSELVRMAVDGAVVLDGWKGKAGDLVGDYQQVSAGLHSVKLEAAQQAKGPAYYMVGWSPEAPCDDGTWKLQYFSDPKFAHHRATECLAASADGALDQSWGAAGPALLKQPAGYAVRALASFVFPKGKYTFVEQAGGEARLWVAGQQVLSKPGTSGAVAAQGATPLKAEMVHAEGDAKLQVSWQQMSFLQLRR